MKNEKSILYVQTSDQPERQYSPLVLAQSAKAMELEPAVYYLGMGLKVLKPGAADAIQLGSFPSVKEMLNKTLAMGIPVYVCEASKQMLGWETVTSSRASRSSARRPSTTSPSMPAPRCGSESG